MNKTKENSLSPKEKILFTTEELQAYVACGRASAVKIGTAAGAKVTIGRRVLWNRMKIEKYVEQIAI